MAASINPVIKLVAPGPAIDIQTPNSPVIFPCADAIKAAVSSCRVNIKSILSFFLIALSRGKLESPGIPKMCLTPKATNCSIIFSATLVSISSSPLLTPSITKADLGAPHTGQFQDSGKSTNFLPSVLSS
ncbi:hypothetical protein ES703_17802 [subsurface metagenome]